jgi:AraC-like DNA-binding protein
VQPSVNIFAIFFLLGAAHGIFLAIALLTIKGGNRLANRIFAILLMVWALPLLTAAAYRSNYILSFPHLMKNEVPLIFVYGPLFLLYVQSLTSKRFAFKKRHLLHFIPFVIDVGYLLPFYLQSSAEKINFWTNLPPGHGPMRSDLEEALGVCHVLVYSILTIRLLVNHGRSIKDSFADSDLSLQKLAKKLAIPSHHLSQIINERLQKNFFEFVNSYRVAEAKKLLADPAKKHLNIAEIGFNVGFNSLSTFNAAFKNLTQMTPSLFRKQASITN